jgi:proline iminopeptidase
MGDGEGVRLSYRMLGSGKPLVVIHDGPGYEKSIMYKGFDGLKSDMRVIYYDQRGCGKSEPLAGIISSRIDDNVRDLEALRRYFHIEKMSLAAHGWGAVIALEYARKYPARVQAMMLITPISPFSPQPQIESMLDKLPNGAQDEIARALNDPGLSMLERREAMMRVILPSLFYRQDAVRDVKWEGLKYAPDVNLRLGEELSSLDLFPVLGEITQRTLVIVGRHDVSIPVRDQMAYADGMENASAVVFNESGHFPFLEEHDFFMNLVKEFLLKRTVPALVDASRIP